MTTKVRPTAYYIQIVDREKLEAALQDLDTFDIWECVSFVDCETLREARVRAAQHNPVAGIWRRTHIRDNGDYSSEQVPRRIPR